MLKEFNHATLPASTTYALRDDLVSLLTTATARKNGVRSLSCCAVSHRDNRASVDEISNQYLNDDNISPEQTK